MSKVYKQSITNTLNNSTHDIIASRCDDKLRVVIYNVTNGMIDCEEYNHYNFDDYTELGLYKVIRDDYEKYISSLTNKE